MESKSSRRTRRVRESKASRDAAVIEELGQQAIASTMFRHTFGIVSDLNGVEGCGIGSGVGLLWEDKHLILTAAHNLKDTPVNRLYFSVPTETLEFAESAAAADWSKVNLRPRFKLARPKVLIAEGAVDLAVIVLSTQPARATEMHFYKVGGTEVAPPLGHIVGFSGYPAARALPIGKNYMVTPFHDFGQICHRSVESDPKTQMLIEYESAAEVEPHGLSGSGIWQFPKSGSRIWSAKIVLAGLITHYHRKSGVLVGYNVQTALRFLRSNKGWIASC